MSLTGWSHRNIIMVCDGPWLSVLKVGASSVEMSVSMLYVGVDTMSVPRVGKARLTPGSPPFPPRGYFGIDDSMSSSGSLSITCKKSIKLWIDHCTFTRTFFWYTLFFHVTFEGSISGCFRTCFRCLRCCIGMTSGSWFDIDPGSRPGFMSSLFMCRKKSAEKKERRLQNFTFFLGLLFLYV